MSVLNEKRIIEERRLGGSRALPARGWTGTSRGVGISLQSSLQRAMKSRELEQVQAISTEFANQAR